MPSEPRKHYLGSKKGGRDEKEKRIRSGKVIKGFREKCKTALRSPFTCVSIADVSERKNKRRKGRELMKMKCYCWGYSLFGVNW